MSEIMGIDIGYGNTKAGSDILIPSGVKKLANEPPFYNSVVEYNDEYYTVGRSTLAVPKSKTENENTLILTMAAIAEGLRKKGRNSDELRLGVGLPLTRMGAEKQDYLEYMMRNRRLRFRYEGSSYDVYILSVNVYPQGYSGVISKQKEFGSSAVVVDIGSWTVDVLPLIDDIPDLARCMSLQMGVITAMNEINESLRQKFGEEADESILKEVMMNGYSNINRNYLRVIREGLFSYVDDIMNNLRAQKFNSTLTHFIFIGGGAVVIKNFLKEKDRNITIIDDIYINSKGYEELVKKEYRVG